MKSINKYCKEIGLIRLLACIAIFMYHLGILKGGYLAVCIFFVLSGYLTSTSCFKKEKFSLGKFYLNKFLKIYLPLLIVAFISIVSVSFIKSINWFNLKPETTSVLLGYNNFWQLNANLDYFARHIDSPFMHLWYIAIILQFDIVFPLIFKFLKFLAKRIHRSIPIIVLSILAIGTSVLFYYSSLSRNIMSTYYHTFTRIFSLIFGVLLGFIHYYYKPLVLKKFNKKLIENILFYFYIVVLTLLAIFIEADSKFFAVSMLLTTLITCRLIDYSLAINVSKLNIFDKIVKFLSGISYEVYLVQYPVIFIMQYVEINILVKYLLIVGITLAISYLINFSLNYKLNKVKILRYIMFIVVVCVSSFGIYKYVQAKDYTSEMKELELQLVENEELMRKQQEKYAEKLKQDQENWNNTLTDLENYEKELPSYVANLPVVGIGDSVMLGVLGLMHNKFPNGYFDAQISRTAWVVNGILRNLQALGILGDPVILNLGANGDCDTACKNAIISTVGNRKLFWVNVPNYNSVNNSISALAARYENVYVVDWYSISRGHPEYFIADGVHLTALGAQVYVDTIYNAIYNVYFEEYKKKKDAIIDSYNEEQKRKITFFGNELLLNVYNYLNSELIEAEFVMDSNANYEELKKQLKDKKQSGSLTHQLFLVFDKQTKLTETQYKELISLYSEHKIYIVNVNKDLNIEETDNIKVIDFYLELNKNDKYLMPDGIHLTNSGNMVLKNMILNKISE